MGDLEQQADGGQAGGVEGDAGAEAGNQNVENAGAEGGAGADGGAGKTAEPTIESLTKELADSKTNVERLTSKMGKQSESVGLVNKMNDALARDPKQAIAAMMKKFNVNFDSPAGGDASQTLSKAMTDGPVDGQGKAILAAMDEKIAAFNALTESRFQGLQEVDNSNQFNDWDDMAESRSVVSQAVAAGQMSESQLQHYAARGLNLAGSLEDAGKMAVEKYKADLSRKNEEQIEGGTGGEGKSSDVSTEDWLKGLGNG